MASVFVLYNEKFKTGQYGPDDEIVAVPKLKEAVHVVVRAEYTWVEYQLEEDGVTRCNGAIRYDLMIEPSSPPTPVPEPDEEPATPSDEEPLVPSAPPEE